MCVLYFHLFPPFFFFFFCPWRVYTPKCTNCASKKIHNWRIFLQSPFTLYCKISHVKYAFTHQEVTCTSDFLRITLNNTLKRKKHHVPNGAFSHRKQCDNLGAFYASKYSEPSLRCYNVNPFPTSDMYAIMSARESGAEP